MTLADKVVYCVTACLYVIYCDGKHVTVVKTLKAHCYIVLFTERIDGCGVQLRTEQYRTVYGS